MAGKLTGQLLNPSAEAKQNLQRMIELNRPGKKQVQEDAFGFFGDDDSDESEERGKVTPIVNSDV